MNSRGSSSAAYLQLALGQIALGTWALVVRPTEVHPLWGATLVFAVVAVASVPLLWLPGARPPVAPQDHRRRVGALLWMALLGLLNGGNVWLYFAMLKSTQIATAAFLHCFTPVIIAVAAPSLLGTRRDMRLVISALFAVVGLALMAHGTGSPETQAGASLATLALGATGAVLGSAYVLINKRLAERFTPEERLAAHASFATLLLAGTALVSQPSLPNMRDAAWLALIAGLLGTAGAWCFLRGLQRVPAEKAGILMLLQPLTGLVIGWVAFGERLGLLAMAGALLLIGSSVFALAGRKPAAKSASHNAVLQGSRASQQEP